MAWATSDRASRLPRDWAAIRAQVRDRAGGRCEADVHHPRCDGWGTDADNDDPGDDHAMANLQWLNTWCHRAKTAREGAARRRARAAARRRPHESHPGEIA